MSQLTTLSVAYVAERGPYVAERDLSFNKIRRERRYSELGELHVSGVVRDLLAEVVVAPAGGESGS